MELVHFSFPQAMNEISSASKSLLKVGASVLDFDHPNKCVVNCGCCDSNLLISVLSLWKFF